MSETTQAAPVFDDKVVITLAKPITALGKTIGEITLRAPGGRDLSAAGYPTRFDSKGRTEIDAPVMTKLIARLSSTPDFASLPDTAAEEMTGRDWNKCALLIAGFLGSGEAEKTS